MKNYIIFSIQQGKTKDTLQSKNEEKILNEKLKTLNVDAFEFETAENEDLKFIQMKAEFAKQLSSLKEENKALIEENKLAKKELEERNRSFAQKLEEKDNIIAREMAYFREDLTKLKAVRNLFPPGKKHFYQFLFLSKI